jgi:hypothetical protein
MKPSLLAFSLAAAVAAAEPACPGAAVYIFDNNSNNNNQQQQKNQPATLNLHQAQLVLADFVGVSQLYSLKDAHFPAGYRAPCGGKHRLFGSDENDLNGKPPTAVVVVNGLPENHKSLFVQDGSSSSTIDDVVSPAFNIDEAPTSSFFRAFFDRISNDVTELYNGDLKSTVDKAVFVISHFASEVEAAAREGLTGAGFFKRSLRHMDDGEDASHHRHMEEIAHIRRLGLGLTRGQTAFVRIESLNMLQNDGSNEYHSALKDISSALRDLVASGSDLRLMVIAAPRAACAHKARQMIKRSATSSSSTTLFKRALELTAATGPYRSKEACELATDSCSGHGHCRALANGLYACACEKSYNADKRKTTYYAGSACEKKDVSVETQMFLWTGIGIVFAIIAGIKLLFSIDSQPLPGILNVGKRSSSSN